MLERAKKITHIFLDVDGVLTDGKIIYGESGKELKYFDVKDGVGIKLAQKAGIEFVIITGRTSEILTQRCLELDIKFVYQGNWDKLGQLKKILKKKKIPLDHIAYMGDDIVDLPVMKRIGLAAAPSDCVQEIREISHFITNKPGGYGAVRELIEFILKSQEKWDEILSKYKQ
ncbi:MAG: hypothetical protein A2161_03705 [Candidatus Schekmanbacteria bacterium RBG_13_48_7]|uniref:3-deoxy-D-manno-octulosonate 8-phosphate phosphatase n=1 Tax=Candidatus Schekmanbacteria bacterium RBG_13_48_7 TaxID=1817878 RepID=A0A1F7RXM3_9BACT|nr:MAG: hypothetical protein A2161_03705 [Candidatus Schekmanbacteria bacterium RBG_13_48_7]